MSYIEILNDWKSNLLEMPNINKATIDMIENLIQKESAK